MTLITYPTRVHFADDVLEEALLSELERERFSSALLVMPNTSIHPGLEERVRSGFPPRFETHTVTCTDQSDLRAIAREVLSLAFRPDVIIAFGAARAIELARKCRYGFGQKMDASVPLYAVPGIDGLPGPCTSNLQSWRAGLPTVLICDPTVALDAQDVQSRRSWVLSVVRCCESYLANTYNPPADGMALDALNRCVNARLKVGKVQDVDLHRELMAAGLNASLSQEKGVGPALAISGVLVDVVQGLDIADVARIVLPAMMGARSIQPDRADALLKVMGQRGDLTLKLAIQRMLDAPDKSETLRALGVPHSALDPAAHAAEGTLGLNFEKAREALETIF
jgi:alcohol dehydrogenase class IV